MTFVIRKAERKQAKLRIGVSGPSGSGKTYSALLLARGLTSSWNKVGMIDTENGSGELYSHLGDYNVITLEAPFTPERYIEAIKAFQDAGIEALVIDSTSHEWEGSGGCLDIVEKLGGKYQDWGKVTPRHNAFIQSILQSDMHIITTTRRKQDYEMTKNGDGKVKVEKVGLKEVQRDGFEYELTLALNIDTRHYASTSKDRTGLFMDKPEFIITEKTGELLRDWAASGKVVDVEVKIKKTKILESLKALGYGIKSLDQVLSAVIEATNLELTEENYDAIINILDVKLKNLNDAVDVAPKNPIKKVSVQSKLNTALKK